MWSVPDELLIPVELQHDGNAVEFHALWDTGTGPGIISRAIADRLGLKIEEMDMALQDWAGGNLTLGKCTEAVVTIKSGTQTRTNCRLLVADKLATPFMIFGREFMAWFKYQQGNFPTQFPSEIAAGVDESEWVDPTQRRPRLGPENEGLSPEEIEKFESGRAVIATLLESHCEATKAGGFCSHPLATFEWKHEPNTEPVFRNYKPKAAMLPLYEQFIAKQLEGPEPLIEEFNPDIHVPLDVRVKGVSWHHALLAVVTKSPSGETREVRFVSDFKAHNKGTVVDDYPLPRIGDFYQKFANCTVFSEFDLKKFFWQIRLGEGSKYKTVFSAMGKQWVFRGAPMGIASLSAWAQRLMDTIFAGCDFAFCYLDNIIVGSRSIEEHIEHCRFILETCTKFNLRCHGPEKAKIGRSQLATLGNVITKEGTRCDPEKVAAVQSWATPTNQAELLSFLCFCGFLRGYVRHFAELEADLRALSCSTTWHWTAAHQRDFETLKEAIARAPYLCFADYTKNFALACDASRRGIGAVLWQPRFASDVPCQENIVSFTSRALRKYERGYSVYRLELLALLFALTTYHDFIAGRGPIVVHTDHVALTYMFSQKKLSNTLLMWLGTILEYDLDVTHVPGWTNTLPDLLSRYSDGGGWGLLRRWRDLSLLPQLPVNLVQLERFDRTLLEETAREAKWERGSPPANVMRVSVDAHLAELRKVFTDATLAAQPIPFAKPLIKTPPPTVEAQIRLIEDMHTEGVHFGRRSLFKKLRAAGWLWPGMSSQIKKVVENCRRCQEWTRTRFGFTPMRSITAKFQPWDDISIDIQTSKTTSREGFTSLMVVVDTFTGFNLLRPLKTREAREIGEELWWIFGTFGPPSSLRSDSEAAFLSDIVQYIVNKYGIVHEQIANYNPRIQGKVERAGGVASTALKKLIDDTSLDWPNLVAPVQLGINANIRHLTNASPFALMFNRQVNGWEVYNDLRLEGASPADVDAWLHKQQELWQHVFPLVATRSLSLQAQQAADFNKRHFLRPSVLPTGSRVMIEDVLREDKNAPPYIGPYTVVGHHNHLYILRDDAGGIFHRGVPIDHIKPVPLATKQDDVWYVERILQHRSLPGGKFEYKVKWAGHGTEDATWEPDDHILDKNLIRNYLAEHHHLPKNRKLAATPAAMEAQAAPRAAPKAAQVLSGAATQGMAAHDEEIGQKRIRKPSQRLKD